MNVELPVLTNQPGAQACLSAPPARALLPPAAAAAPASGVWAAGPWSSSAASTAPPVPAPPVSGVSGTLAGTLAYPNTGGELGGCTDAARPAVPDASAAMEALALGAGDPDPDAGGRTSPAHSETASAPGPSRAPSLAAAAAMHRSFDSISTHAAQPGTLSPGDRSLQGLGSSGARAPIPDPAPLRIASPRAPPVHLPSPASPASAPAKAAEASGAGPGYGFSFGTGLLSPGAMRSAAPLGDISNLGAGGAAAAAPGLAAPATPVLAQASRAPEAANRPGALVPLLTPPPPARVFADARDASAHVQARLSCRPRLSATHTLHTP